MIDRKDKLITKLFIEICSVAYYFRRFLGGQRGTRAKLSRMLKTLARTGTILSSYLRNRNFQFLTRPAAISDLLSFQPVNSLLSLWPDPSLSQKLTLVGSRANKWHIWFLRYFWTASHGQIIVHSFIIYWYRIFIKISSIGLSWENGIFELEEIEFLMRIIINGMYNFIKI